MSATYDITTAVGQTRLHASDTDVANATFDDSELTYFLSINANDPVLAAAMALDALASDQARIAVLTKYGDQSRDWRSVAAELRESAARLRSLSDVSPVIDPPDAIFTLAADDGMEPGTTDVW